MRHSALIEALGGGTQVAKLLEDVPGGGKIDREAVYKWAERDFIPWKWRPAVMAVARAHGKAIPEGFIPGVEPETMQ